MVKKEELHLGQKVMVQMDGGEEELGVIDGLVQTFAGVRLSGGGYGYFDYDRIRMAEVVEDVCHV